MKQTAVEWFSDNVLSYKNPTNINGTDYILIPINKVEYLKEQAKEMEKEQTINFAYDYVNSGSIGCLFDGDSAPELDIDTDPRQYYHRTFNTKEK